MSEDIEKFSEECVPVILRFLIQPVIILWYAVNAGLLAYWIPLVVAVHFAAGLLVLKLPMTPMMQEIVRLDQAEGDLRYAHAMAKKQAEAIAITDGGDVHRLDVQAKFARVMHVQHRVNRLSALIDALRTYFNYSNSFLSYAVVVLSLRFGALQVSSLGMAATISNACFYIMTLLYKLSGITDLAENISKVNGHGLRLIELARRLEDTCDEHQPLLPDASATSATATTSSSSSVTNPRASRRESCYSGPECASIAFDKVDLFSPDERLLVYGLSLKIWSGQNTFIHGPSGSGKSSLVKLLTGLWKPKHGSAAIALPPNVERPAVMFAPQQPILISGSLIDQLHYPVEAPPVADEARILDCMKAVSLDYLVERLELRNPGKGLHAVLSTSDWTNLMSPGEVQRIILARFLLHRPVFAVLDEATNAIEAGREEQIYNALWAAGVTTITVSHRDGYVRDQASIIIGFDGLGNHQIEHK